jgi:hypothetical protein
MQTMSFRKLALIFSAVAGIGVSLALACADGWFYYDYDSNFTPEVFIDKSYSPLFFAPNETFYGNSFDTNYNSRFNDAIVKEWSGFLESSIPQAQLSFLLLNDSASSVIQVLFQSANKKSKAPAPYEALSLTNPKIKGFIDFLYYAKAIEKSSVTRADPWDYNPGVNRENVSAATRAAIDKLWNETRDPFLKNRFWFQLVKALFYSSEPAQLLTFLDKTKDSQPKNGLYYRAISYAAGVHYRVKNFPQSNYLYSIVFDQFPPLRQVAAYNFHPQEQEDFHAALALAKNKNEKSALWAMLGYYGDEFTAIKEINSINSGSEHLSYLLTRLINKQEVTVNNESFQSVIKYKTMMRESLKKGQLEVIENIANSGATSRQDLWFIGAGYLNTFTGRYQQASMYFDRAENLRGLSPDVLREIRLLRIINTVCSLEQMDEESEKKLLPELQWVLKNCETADENFRCSHVIGWSKKYISFLYSRANNKIMAELFDPSGIYYRNDEALEKMKIFLQSQNHSAWEKFIVKIYHISLSDIFEYQAQMYAYDGNLDASISHMEKSLSKNVELLGNPFYGKIKDCHDCDHSAPQKIKYTKLAMLQTMKEMQSNIDINNDIYSNSLLLANAYYNITFHGNARVFYEGDILNQSGNDIDPLYHPQLLGCQRALSYYQKAFDAAATLEQKAKCVYMMAKCERNEYYNTTAYSDNGGFDADFVKWESFGKLKEQYSETRYYRDVIKECSYFRTYLGLKE